MEEHPPRWQNANKKAVFQRCCPAGCQHSGALTYSRWMAMDLLEHLGEPNRTVFVCREDLFDYLPTVTEVPVVEWHLNFAASDVFCAYAAGLLAQDEMQVAEHPALAALREALIALGESTLTVESGRPTPILVMGVERRCRIRTDPNVAEGRPSGLYGNEFASASTRTIEQAVEVINPPTVSNIIAIEAPAYGCGKYQEDEIRFILQTAYSGFAAARIASGQARIDNPQVIVHTGFWGCGAYGGNRVLMAMLQLLAGRLAELDRMVFHSFDPKGTQAYRQAVKRLEGALLEIGPDARLERIVEVIQAQGFEWGVSDGN